MEHQDHDSLYIPSGLKTNTEIFDGYGKVELMGTILATAIGGAVAAGLNHIIKSIPLCIIFVLAVMAGSVTMLMKDGNMNLSVLDQLRYMVRFWKCRKFYTYRYLDEWNLVNRD
jgi:hypothetical protein